MPTQNVQEQLRSLADAFAKGKIDFNEFNRVSTELNNIPVPVVPVGPAPAEDAPVGVSYVGPAPADEAPVGVVPVDTPVPVTRIPESKGPKVNMIGGLVPVADTGAAKPASRTPKSGPSSLPQRVPVNQQKPVVAPAVKDKNGSTKKDSTSGIAAGMGASNPTGSQTPSASARFQGYGPNFGYIDDKQLPPGSTGYANKGGGYTVVDSKGNKKTYASEQDALNGGESPMTVNYPGAGNVSTPSAPSGDASVSYPGADMNTPATEVDEASMNVPATEGTPELSPESKADLEKFMNDMPEFNTPATEPGAPSGFGSIPTRRGSPNRREYRGPSNYSASAPATKKPSDRRGPAGKR